MIFRPNSRSRSRRSARALAFWFGLLLALCVWTSVGTLHAEDRIWSALVLASTVENPAEPPAELKPLAAKIQRVFGCNQVELLGTAVKTIDEDEERWLVPTPNFWMCARAHRVGENSYTVKMSVYQDKRCLVQGEAKLGANSPILIRGPMHARGQIVMVLKVDR